MSVVYQDPLQQLAREHGERLRKEAAASRLVHEARRPQRRRPERAPSGDGARHGFPPATRGAPRPS